MLHAKYGDEVTLMNMTNTANGSFYHLAGKWRLMLLRGVCGVLFGIIALFWPYIALFSIVLVYGVFIVLDGVIALWASFGGNGTDAGRGLRASRRWLLLVGLIGVFAGLLMLFNPFFGAVVIVACVGFWCIFRGVLELVWHARLQRGAPDSGWLLLDAVVSLLFGVLVLVWPLASAIALTWGLGAFALVTGILQIGFALKLRGNRA